ncbi:hypothetical protein BX666DRAFT_1940653 [Dichotomocladium elegans]|nr:hypothetical protein BX666DRAFT_1940653 [Dichotomocladium elegans]
MQKSLASHIVIPPQSPSAIPIVAPSEDASPAVGTANAPNDTAPKPVFKPASKGNANAKRLCRNVIIHGFCKFEGKGCEFNHETSKSTPQESHENGKTKLRIQSPAVRSNLGMVSSVSADSVNAPVFVPKSATPTGIVTVDPAMFDGKGDMAESAHQQNSILSATSGQHENGFGHSPGVPKTSALTSSFSQLGLSGETTAPTSPLQPQHQSPVSAMGGMNMMQTGPIDPYYYMNAPIFTRQPLQYHLCSQPLPHVTALLPHQRAIQSFFMPDNLREELTQRNEIALMSAPARELGLPQEVHVYHSLYPLEDQTQPPHKSIFFDHPTSVYKAVSSVDGRTYVLYRIEGFRLVNELSMAFVERWRQIRHTNIVAIHEAFTTRAFGDASLIFVYDYHPRARTLYSTYFTGQPQYVNNNGSVLIPEATLWSYITQIASVIKKVHDAGLAVRSIDPSKILVTGKNRLRVICAAALDVLQFDTKNNSLEEHQQEDFLAFGKLIIGLACNSPQSYHNLPRSFELLSHYYSSDIKQIVLYLLSKPTSAKTIDDVVTMIGPRILHEIDCSQSYADVLESELSRELENGRLVRLLAKLGFINERPEFDMDPSWSETGDRYIIKLFRDYVFHQVDENGAPVVDMVHVLTCLNKLDAGVDEKIMLMSRDEQSCLIVSYKEIKNCIISAFKDLSSGRK